MKIKKKKLYYKADINEHYTIVETNLTNRNLELVTPTHLLIKLISLFKKITIRKHVT